LQAALHAVEQEVAAEVASYKATRRAEALQQLAGRLTDDTAAAARQLERQTAELQRLEAAVADKAAVLQKLSEEVASKQQQQQQQLLHSLSSSSERGGDAQALSNSREQLAAVQQQLAQAEKQLAAADAALLEKRAAVGEAGEQLAALRRETSVCEPRLGSLRQQLQELEANIRARTTEHQVRGRGAGRGGWTHSLGTAASWIG
jgi:chromosome segregation ATPase